MAGAVKNALITSFLSRTRDRFHEYHAVKTLEERLETASHIDGISGVEVVHHYEADDPAALRLLLGKHRLGIAAINANVKAEPDFRDGGLTSVDSGIRAEAVGFIKRAKEFAKAVGADKVTCCPLGDGYQFNFHCDYARMWRSLVEGFGEAASHVPEVRLFVEYKPSETRARCFVDTAAKALCLIQDIQSPDMGVTIDFGHSLYAQENPAEAFSLVVSRGQRAYVHINDNDGRWDWDLIAGSRHFVDYVEFLFYLMEYGYDDYLTSDTSPTRLAIEGTFAANARLTSRVWQRLQEIDRPRSLVSRRDYLETWKFIEEHILRLTSRGRSVVISASERESAVRRAAQMIERAGVPLRKDEATLIEVADFGLGRVEVEGAEILTIAESPRLVVKVIVLFPGQTLPEHWHPPLGDDPGKEETVRAIWGSFAVFTPGRADTPASTPPRGKEQFYTAHRGHLLGPGEQVYLPPGTRHWFQGGPEGAVAWSFTSTARDALDQFTDPHVVRKTIVQA